MCSTAFTTRTDADERFNQGPAKLRDSIRIRIGRFRFDSKVTG